MSEPLVFRVGEKLPVVLTREQLASIIGVGRSQFDVLRKARNHPAIQELLPRVGRPRFSGAAVQRWLDQQVEPDPKFLGKARKRHRGVS